KKNTTRKPFSVAFLLVLLYFAVDFVPRFGAGDVMGSQWVYLTILNLATVGFILLDRTREYQQAVTQVSRNLLTWLYGVLLIWAAFSFSISINKVESLVTYSRFVDTAIMYFNLAILLYGRLEIIRWLAPIISLALLIQSINILSQFYAGLGEVSLDTLIYNLKGNAGNKNILAASLVMKMGFTIYSIHVSRLWGKIAHSLILLLGGITIFLVNARASYIGLILEVLVFSTFIAFILYKKVTARKLAFISITPFIPLLFSFLIAQSIFKNAVSLQEEQTSYGTVTERLGSISITPEGSNARVMQWSSAIDYIKHHGLMGSGFGNWKLVSIPYEKTYVNDFYVTYHVHNDFLEMAAELGIPGGLLYIGMFVLAALYLLKTIFSGASEQIKIISLLSLMILGGYFTDAFFNFPMERPVMQFYFALVLGLSINSRFSSRAPAGEGIIFSKISRFLTLGLLMAMLIPILYVSILTYQSLVVQTKVNKDMNKPMPETKWQEIINAFPSIPNMNAYCFPIGHVKAFYLMQDKKYNEALTLIHNSAHINPYLTLTEFFKAKIYWATGNTDSAFYYASKAFWDKPRSKGSYDLLNEINIQRKDTATLTRSFREYIHYRNEPWAWDRYLGIMIYLPNNQQELITLADSAIKLFPNYTSLQQKRLQLGSEQQAQTFTAEQQSQFLSLFNSGMDDYLGQNFPSAITKFSKASQLNPNDFISVENIGLSYFALTQYNKAIPYFDKVIKSKSTTDGKSEYYKALCLLNTGRKEEGCLALRLAQQKNYPDAPATIAASCN
ncbi:MAG TPA: O-antigen ligase family protein, partial [Chitinophagaceae bacterium]|nr:O-antigen ligase family protein [Chitinophagaceae bacterium]